VAHFQKSNTAAGKIDPIKLYLSYIQITVGSVVVDFVGQIPYYRPVAMSLETTIPSCSLTTRPSGMSRALRMCQAKVTASFAWAGFTSP
jgi:hypothetical protein